MILENFSKFNLKDVHKVAVFMLGITNHWSSLLAHKYNDKIEFWYFDSRDADYITMTKEEIV
jgi:hypothetical protein